MQQKNNQLSIWTPKGSELLNRRVDPALTRITGIVNEISIGKESTGSSILNQWFVAPPGEERPKSNTPVHAFFTIPVNVVKVEQKFILKGLFLKLEGPSGTERPGGPVQTQRNWIYIINSEKVCCLAELCLCRTRSMQKLHRFVCGVRTV